MQWFAGRATLLLLLSICLLVPCPSIGQAQDLDELLQKAVAAQSAGNYADAAALYASATARSPATPELWSNRGVMEYLAGHADASIASLKHALRLNPGLFTPMLFLGKAYVQTGQPVLALPYLNHAHALRPKDVEVLLGLGKASAGVGHPRQAAYFYAEATRTAPGNEEAWLSLGASSLDVIAADGRSLAASQAQSVWARALYADELLAQGRPLEATDTYKAALAGASPAQKATLARALDWLQSHPDLFPMPPNSQGALQQLVAQLQSAPDKAPLPPCGPSAPPIVGAACAYWAGDYERSAAQARQVLEQSPQDAEALYWSVKANERIAVASLARFEELAPQSAASYAMVGDLYRLQRQTDSALAEYKKALAIDAHYPAALMGAVSADLAGGDLVEAAAIDQTALADRPLDPQLNLFMAEVLAAGQHYAESRPYLAKCLAAPPELQSRVHYLMGRAEMEDGNTAEAVRQFEIALPGDKDGSIHYQLSRLYRKRGDLARAQQTETEARALIKKRDANAFIAVREATAAPQQ